MNAFKGTPGPLVPSSWNLNQQITAAMAKCDASVEQARLRREAELDERAARQWTAQVDARRRARLYGEIR